MRFLNKLGNAFFARAFSFLLGQPIKDTLCGTKVLWKKDYEHIVQNRSYFRKIRSVRRFRPDLRSEPPQSQDRRASGALPQPHVRRDQHPTVP